MKTVLITGASSGIGRELSKQFASRGFSLVLVARRQELLQSLQEELVCKYNVDAKYLVCDIAKNPRDVYNYCKENDIRIDVLVNNAGYGDYGGCQYMFTSTGGTFASTPRVNTTYYLWVE